MNISPPIRQRFFDSNGLPLSGGQLFSYAAGTSTPLVTYSNQAGTPNTNPVVLDSQGYCDLWLDPALGYKFILKDSLGNLQWTEDNIAFSVLTTIAYVPKSGGMYQGATVQGALDFINPYVSGSKASPTSISGSAAIALVAGVAKQTWVIKGNGGAVTGVTLSTASLQVGQRVVLIGGDDTNTITIAQGAAGTVMSGDLVLGATSSGSRSASCELEFDGTNCQEVSRT